MPQVLTGILAIGMLAIVSALLYVATEVRQLRVVLTRAGVKAVPSSQSQDPVTDVGGHAHYVWDGRSWILSENFSRPGYEPVRPRIDGAFEHQVLRTRSVPSHASDH